MHGGQDTRRGTPSPKRLQAYIPRPVALVGRQWLDGYKSRRPRQGEGPWDIAVTLTPR